VNDERLREAFRDVRVPNEEASEERAWRVVAGAFAEREPVPRRIRVGPLAALAFAALVAVAAAAVTSPVRGWIRERVAGEPAARHAVVRLPAPGRLLVTAGTGAWIVDADGSKRRLGDYEQASWSPRGLFVVATRGPRLVAVDPKGNVRWELSRPPRVTDPRWAPGDGYRVAYRVGRTLRVVAGDGTGDRLLARNVAPVAPAWRPGRRHVLAYVDRRAGIHVVDVDRRRVLWETRPIADPAARPAIRKLEWSANGRGLIAVSPQSTVEYGRGGNALLVLRRDWQTAAYGPSGYGLAYTVRRLGRKTAVIADGRTLFVAKGDLRELAWSPNGRWLVVAWPAADEWLFVRTTGVHKVVAVSGIGREFDPGGAGAPSFPRIAGWCCPPTG
jgi:hypothetical protein